MKDDAQSGYGADAGIREGEADLVGVAGKLRVGRGKVMMGREEGGSYAGQSYCKGPGAGAIAVSGL